MSRLENDVEDSQDNPPDGVLSLDYLEEENTIEVTLERDAEEVYTLMLAEGFERDYPHAEAQVVLHGCLEELGKGSIRQLLDRLLSLATRLPRATTSQSDGLPTQPSTDYYDDHPHPQLERDVAHVIERYGEGSVLVDHRKSLDSVLVTLRLDISYLDAMVCSAWGLAPKGLGRPLDLSIEFSRSGYLDSNKHIVKCGQEGRDWCGLGGQMRVIITNMLDEVYKTRQEDLRCGVTAAERLDRDLKADSAAQERLRTKKTSRERRAADKKSLPPDTDGLLCRIMEYAHRRTPTCPEYCVICDQPHVFATGMLKASVCSRDVCAFVFQQLGIGRDAAKDLATDAGVVDLLVRMAQAAARSGRWEKILKPYPTVFGDDQQKKVMHPDLIKQDNINVVRSVMSSFPKAKELSQANSIGGKESLVSYHKYAYPLLQWIISSNTSHLVKLQYSQLIPKITTPHQFLMVSAAPEKQARFNKLKNTHRTVFAFHGSSAENWHSILRNGLYNASGTELQVNGAAHGAGIYLSPAAGVSLGYSSISGNTGTKLTEKKVHEHPYLGESLGCMAICEVIDKDIRKSGDIWVQPHSDYVITRFFICFDENFEANASLHTVSDTEFARQLRDACNVQAAA